MLGETYVNLCKSLFLNGLISLSLLLGLSSDGETPVPVCQCRGTVAPTEQAAAHDCIPLPLSLLLQVRRPLPPCSSCSLDFFPSDIKHLQNAIQCQNV